MLAAAARTPVTHFESALAHWWVSHHPADTKLRVGDNGSRSSPQEMSEEQLKAFLEAVKADAGLQEMLKTAGDADAVVAIAKAMGFVISAGELQKAQAEAGLSDEGLEGASGGFGSTVGLMRGGPL